MEQTEIRDLGIIGDRRTCALISKEGEVLWYCPERFDKPAFFTKLIDPGKGGNWFFDFQNKKYIDRSYNERSGVLRTEYRNLQVTDFMPLDEHHRGICRIFSEAPEDIINTIFPKPYYGIGLPEYEEDKEHNIIIISRSLFFTASHPVSLVDGKMKFTIPKGEKGWAFLSEQPIKEKLAEEKIIELKDQTLESWKEIASKITYNGIYQKEVYNSIRAIQLMTFQENGGIIAAATTSLPEVKGGSRNYDYRYVWLRDAAMITGALVRAESSGEEEEKFLSFLCDAKYRNSQKILLPFYSLDKLVAQPEEYLPLEGYRQSIPVRTGNNAMDQLQLDANANVLLAAKLIYNKTGNKLHWETIVSIADYLVERWDEKDHGIWEEDAKEHFTSSKVIVAKGLEFIAEFAEDDEQKSKWLDTAKKIRSFIQEKCLTSEGAYATYAGSEKVDVTAALFPVWLFGEPHDPAMNKTIEIIEKKHRDGELYHRTLENFDASKEGVFLAGCFWMSQYYIMTQDLPKAEKIIEAALEFSNDLGFFAEEGSKEGKEMLGNFPQTSVHASFIGAILDLNKKRDGGTYSSL